MRKELTIMLATVALCMAPGCSPNKVEVGDVELSEAGGNPVGAVFDAIEETRRLWTNDTRTAYRKIKRIKDMEVSVLVSNETACLQFVKFADELDASLIPIKERRYYFSHTFGVLVNAMWRTLKDCPKNYEYYLMVEAVFAGKCTEELAQVETFLRNNPETPNPLPIRQPTGSLPYRYVTPENKGQYERWREKQTEIEAAKVLRTYLQTKLHHYSQMFFDSKYDGRQIKSLSEPNRTRLINFIESRLGRRMKWRDEDSGRLTN